MNLFRKLVESGTRLWKSSLIVGVVSGNDPVSVSEANLTSKKVPVRTVGFIVVFTFILGYVAWMTKIAADYAHQLQAREIRVTLDRAQRGTNEIFDALRSEVEQPQPVATSVPTTDSPSDYETTRLKETSRDLERRVEELKRACEVRDALLRTYEQREAGHVEAARAEFHRALQAANDYGGGEWYLDYKVSPALWDLAAPRFKVYRNKNRGLMAKEVQFASTK